MVDRSWLALINDRFIVDLNPLALIRGRCRLEDVLPVFPHADALDRGCATNCQAFCDSLQGTVVLDVQRLELCTLECYEGLLVDGKNYFAASTEKGSLRSEVAPAVRTKLSARI